MQRVIVCGGRDFNDYELLEKELDRLFASSDDIRIICGKARGADSLGEEYALKRDLPIDYYPAQWNTRGAGAGYIRNLQMIDNADKVVAFWDGESKGTAHCINNARKKGLDVIVVRYR